MMLINGAFWVLFAISMLSYLYGVYIDCWLGGVVVDDDNQAETIAAIEEEKTGKEKKKKRK